MVETAHARVKVCCIASVEEARLAVAHGADALGLVGAMPSGPGPIEDELIARIAATVPPPVATFLLTSETSVDGEDERVRRRLPGIKLVQVLHVEDDRVIEQARVAAHAVDALLLDSGRPSLAIRELGGTGRVHDWGLSRRVVESSPVPVFLAGGLEAGNVTDAIAFVRPFGVDLCRGVRTDAQLDPSKLELFFDAVGRSTRARRGPRPQGG